MWLSAAGLQTNQYRQALIANNLANANTVGFKHDLAVVRQRPIEVNEGGDARFAHPVLDGHTGGSLVAPTHTTFAQGPIEPSSGALDVALDGEGFFSVQADGGTQYTRDGRFTTDAAGRLLMVAGSHPILDTAGQEIILDLSAGTIRIDSAGRLLQGDAAVAQLGVVDFQDKQALRKVGGNRFDAFEQRPIAARAQVRSEALEGATVDPVQALASMIEVARAYQLNANMITMQDQINGRAASDIGRIG
jgi:flagellar basal-body rod protein FlgG